LYEYGFHVPLAICWPKRGPGGRVVDDLVGFVDLTATIIDAAGAEWQAGKPAPQQSGEPAPQQSGKPAAQAAKLEPQGKSLLDILASSKQGTVDPSRTMVFSGRERHSSAR